ncbi:hypothetical protein [Polluticoccus soli]|uniref:hypothetical protein n=1 Tax=Polluticoccus soli TaxID=3034150 RepID=UPI0023E34BE0|nr:hypothetical protein [Flavipsychrobacter sp. JY13-12]
MRKFHSGEAGEEYVPITPEQDDYRAKRITAYLNLLQKIVQQQIAALKKMPFKIGNEIVKYFELLPQGSQQRAAYDKMSALPEGKAKVAMQEHLRSLVTPGSIDVNIMSKVDNLRYDKKGDPLPVEYSDAMSALRGFAHSNLQSSVVFSAGYNPRLYNYIESFPDFFPDSTGELKKRIVIKVSDYRSALLQGKILAKRGLWVSEFRIESGLNCGGHAFPTDGLLLGPILEEFRKNRINLAAELFDLCRANNGGFHAQPEQLITVQGGIGTSLEHQFLLDHYGVDRTGWGSPFLLVPEATSVDTKTLQQLATARPSDYFLSNASPLGVPFNNFRPSSSEAQRKQRIKQGRPGSPCYKKYLSSNTEFTERPICTASRLYQKLKVEELSERGDEQAKHEIDLVLEKDCLCEGLVAPALIKNDLPPSHNLTAVTICPGPNLVYFSGVFSLQQMIGHIYGRNNLLNGEPRPNMFVNELRMYVDYLKKQVDKISTSKQVKQLVLFKQNLLAGIAYYENLLNKMVNWDDTYLEKMRQQLEYILGELCIIEVPVATEVC